MLRTQYQKKVKELHASPFEIALATNIDMIEIMRYQSGIGVPTQAHAISVGRILGADPSELLQSVPRTLLDTDDQVVEMRSYGGLEAIGTVFPEVRIHHVPSLFTFAQMAKRADDILCNSAAVRDDGDLREGDWVDPFRIAQYLDLDVVPIQRFDGLKGAANAMCALIWSRREIWISTSLLSGDPKAIMLKVSLPILHECGHLTLQHGGTGQRSLLEQSGLRAVAYRPTSKCLIEREAECFAGLLQIPSRVIGRVAGDVIRAFVNQYTALNYFPPQERARDFVESWKSSDSEDSCVQLVLDALCGLPLPEDLIRRRLTQEVCVAAQICPSI